MIALLAPLVAQAVAPGFAPPLDRPLAYTVSEVREDAARTQRFVIERRVTFSADAGGIAAAVETLSVAGEAGRAGRMFEAMARSMIGRRVILRFDRTGALTGVDDIDAIWDAQLAAMTAALAGSDPARAAVVTSLLAPLRSMTPAAKIARIGEMITPLIADLPVVPGAPRAITLPAQGQNGAQALLAGTERVVAERDGTLLLDRRAAGEVGGAPTSILQRRRIDPRSGLLAENVNITTIESAGSRLIVTRSTALKL